MNLIDELKAKYKEITYLNNAAALMAWDMRTYLPKKGINVRAEAYGYISTLAFKMSVSEELGMIIEELNKPEVLESLTEDERAMTSVATRSYKRASALPPEFYQRFMVLVAKSEHAWEEARERNDFDGFAPYLEEIVSLSREATSLYGYDENPYDALLEGYEEGMTAKKLREIIQPLKEELVPLLNKIVKDGKAIEMEFMKGKFSRKAQERLSQKALKFIGYDFEAGRLDETVHPFTIGVGVGDVRVTTKYPRDDFSTSLYGSFHEGGHALYEQGLPVDLSGTPLYGAASLGIHESQSRMIENIVARSREFLTFFYPHIQKAFPSNFKDISLKKFYKAINQVKPSLIRTEADEVTYNLHIMLRFELEEALINGELEVRDLPRRWKDKMNEYLGVEPADYRDGVLQDVHWPSGMIGYFPSYMLGNLYAAQFYAKAQSDIKRLDKRLERGDLKPLVEWLRVNIHSQGRRYRPEELLRKVTGRDLDPGYFIKYVKDKYSDIYSL